MVRLDPGPRLAGGSMFEWAIHYASLGIRVFPCDGKVPLTPHGHLDATTDEATIRASWMSWPLANIGGVPGPQFVVLDLDGLEGMASGAALGIFPPRTSAARTGGGGWHLWFRRSGGRIGNNSNVEGIDVRADAGYVILPPSIHPKTGQQYQWDDVLNPIAEIPSRVLEQLQGPRRAAGNPTTMPETITSGRRNKTLVSLAGALRRVGASEPVLLAALRGINRECVRPPLEERDIEQITRGISRYETESPIPHRGLKRAGGRRPWRWPRP